MPLKFEWNPKKAKKNIEKHGVSFDEAATVFSDPLSMTYNDPDHSYDDLRPEYDLPQLKGGVRGKYASKYREGTNLILLESDVAEVFKDNESVNEALRLLIKIASANNKKVAQPRF